MIKLKNILNKSEHGETIEKSVVNENLQVDQDRLKQAIVQFVDTLIHGEIFTSYAREKTSGLMDPKDFANDLSQKLLTSTQEWIKLVNDRGNWENDEGGMIK